VGVYGGAQGWMGGDQSVAWQIEVLAKNTLNRFNARPFVDLPESR